MIPLALAATSGFGPELQVFGSDYPTPDGTCIRDYIHVSDLDEAHVLALQHVMNGEASLALNPGTGEGYSVKEVLAAVKEVTGKVAPYRMAPRRPGDPPPSPLIHRAFAAMEVGASLRDIVSTAWNWMEQPRNSPGMHPECSPRIVSPSPSKFLDSGPHLVPQPLPDRIVPASDARMRENARARPLQSF